MSRQTFSPEAASLMRMAIQEAQGAEVFFVGRPTRDAVVGEVQVIARGHDTAVPAILAAAHAGEVLLHNHPSGELHPSEADLAVASRAGKLGLGFIIVDNKVEHSYSVVECFRPAERKRLEAGSVSAMLGPRGRLAQVLPSYEHRPPQMGMAESVVDAFNQDRLLVVEAGTGTGKSLAYLLPALSHATANRERVVVSTNTINLQEQLIHQDLPLIAEKLGLEFKSILLKGRSNYLCLRKTEYARREAGRLFEDDRRSSLEAILKWAEKTSEGSRSELSFIPPRDVWEELASDPDDCLGVKSPFFSRCFFFNSRREAAAADILVVNHHLLMADLALRLATGDYSATAVLPPYSRVVIDEAHNLEDVASDFLARRVSRVGLLRTLGRLRSSREVGRGLLPALAEGLADAEGMDPAEAGELAQLVGEELLPGHQRLLARVDAAFAQVAEGVVGFLGLERLPQEELKLRLKPDMLTHPAILEAVLPAASGLAGELGAYATAVARFLARSETTGAPEAPQLLSGLVRLRAVRSRLEGAARLLGGLAKDDPEACRWIETRKRRKEVRVSIASAPLAVGELLERGLFSQVKTAVLTSATLTVARRFEHLTGRLGLKGSEVERLDTRRFASPFDFAEQALVLAPTDIVEPMEVSFGEELASLVERAVTLSRGRAFVLFTSYGLLNRTYGRLWQRLGEAGLVPLKQGDAPRDALLARFRSSPAAVLFATQSFWEGVDVPGDALSLVVLTRLPFRVPTEPIQEARVEAIQREGGDPFSDYSLPQAVIRFRQGFGRLIRTRSDRGVVLIADSRVVRKGYGRLFLDSLPEARVVVGPRKLVLGEMRRFFSAAG